MEAVQRIHWPQKHRDILSKQHQKQRGSKQRGGKRQIPAWIQRLAAEMVHQRQKKLETNLTQDV